MHNAVKHNYVIITTYKPTLSHHQDKISWVWHKFLMLLYLLDKNVFSALLCFISPKFPQNPPKNLISNFLVCFFIYWYILPYLPLWTKIIFVITKIQNILLMVSDVRLHIMPWATPLLWFEDWVDLCV